MWDDRTDQPGGHGAICGNSRLFLKALRSGPERPAVPCWESPVLPALDDVVSSVTADTQRFETATHRTLRWLDRCDAPTTRNPSKTCVSHCSAWSLMFHCRHSALLLPALSASSRISGGFSAAVRRRKIFFNVDWRSTIELQKY